MSAGPKLTARGHVHGEAFCLMVYRCHGDNWGRHCDPSKPRYPPCGHRETFWNSRDGVTPFGTRCPSCGGELLHDNWQADVYAPDHKPHVGQGIWRDGTPEEAERLMRERIERCKGTPYECTPERAEQLIAAVRSTDPFVNTEFQAGWPMFERFGGGQ